MHAFGHNDHLATCMHILGHSDHVAVTEKVKLVWEEPKLKWFLTFIMHEVYWGHTTPSAPDHIRWKSSLTNVVHIMSIREQQLKHSASLGAIQHETTLLVKTFHCVSYGDTYITIHILAFTGEWPQDTWVSAIVLQKDQLTWANMGDLPIWFILLNIYTIHYLSTLPHGFYEPSGYSTAYWLHISHVLHIHWNHQTIPPNMLHWLLARQEWCWTGI